MPFLILMLIAMIALMLMSNSLLKPIREIIQTSKSYAQGNFNARVNVTAKNEFGELARYMEEMADEPAVQMSTGSHLYQIYPMTSDRHSHPSRVT